MYLFPVHTAFKPATMYSTTISPFTHLFSLSFLPYTLPTKQAVFLLSIKLSSVRPSIHHSSFNTFASYTSNTIIITIKLCIPFRWYHTYLYPHGTHCFVWLTREMTGRDLALTQVQLLVWFLHFQLTRCTADYRKNPSGQIVAGQMIDLYILYNLWNNQCQEVK